MTTDTRLLKASKKLKSASISTALLDAQVLMGFVLQKDRAWVLAHPDYVLPGGSLQKYDDFIDRRAGGEPVAYIIGSKEFYGRDFTVNNHVLVPRPESESFIELLADPIMIEPLDEISNVLDMGTGSGCIAITTKLEHPQLNVYATDTSKNALLIAIQNAKKHNVSINFKNQSLLAGDKVDYGIVMANLPYVPDAMQDKSIMHEPKQALFSGDDGLDHYRALFKQLEQKHIRFVMTESLLSQHGAIENLATQAGYKLTKTSELVQLFTKS